MDMQESLLRMVLESPADDLPRLVYADYIQDQGQDARAEFIRLQIEWAKLPEPDEITPGYFPLSNRPSDSTRELCRYHELDLRVYDLHSEVKKGEWSCFPEDICHPGTKWHFARGFVVEIMLSTGEFIRNAEAIFRAQPVEEVTLTDVRFGPGGMGISVHFPDGGDGIFPNPKYSIGYSSTSDARKTISAFAVAIGRKAAGLPPLGEDNVPPNGVRYVLRDGRILRAGQELPETLFGLPVVVED